jgi:hypothetical protein
MRNIRGRLDRLERAMSPIPGCCSECPPIAMVTEDADGNLVEGAYPAPCRRCGGPYGRAIRSVVVQVPVGYVCGASSPVAPG